MTRFSHTAAVILTLLTLAACGARPAPAPAKSALSPVQHELLSRMVDRYWNEHLAAGVPASPQAMADSLALERRYLAEILALPRATLDGNSALTYDIFRRRRELAVEGFTYPAELLAIDPFGGMPQRLAFAAADAGQSPRAAGDYENWLRRIDDYVVWSEQAIANMREGVRRGYTSPRALVERSLPILQGLGEDTSANVFYAPLRSMPESIKEPERTRLSESFKSAVRDKLLPANRKLHDFLLREYLPRARLSLALSALPLGTPWYAYRVRVATGSALSPNEIHSLGTAEVERIRARLPTLPTGAAPLVGSLLATYADFKTQSLSAMPTIFSGDPTTELEIRAVGPVNEPAAFLYYQAAEPASRRTAILYITGNATAVASATALPAAAPQAMPPPETALPPMALPEGFLREALPGRHYQSSLQQARTDLPGFRRFGTEAAFVEGWALYAASLGEELGLYRDDEARSSALLDQLRCAVALVVDTGLHAKGWTRIQALDYLRTQLGLDDVGANLLIDSFIALPGDALACKMGELKIKALRNRAEQVLGTRFDIREFHSEILKDGAMPLDILEAKMKDWMVNKR